MSDLTLIPGRYAAVNTAADVAVNTNLGLYIGTGGNIVVVGRDGVSTTFKVFDAQYLVGRFATGGLPPTAPRQQAFVAP